MGRGAGLGWWGCDERWFSSTLFFPFPSGFHKKLHLHGTEEANGSGILLLFSARRYMEKASAAGSGFRGVALFFCFSFGGEKRVGLARGKTAKG